MDAISHVTRGYISVAQISKTKGYDGTVICTIDDHYLKDLKTAPGVFAVHKGSLVPYFLDKSRSRLSEGLVKFDTINDKEYWADIYPRQLFLSEQDIHEVKPQSKADTFIGWSIFNNEENIGHIEDIEEYPQQIMLVVKRQSGISLIPFHQEFIRSISEDERAIYLELPDGLLEL